MSQSLTPLARSMMTTASTSIFTQKRKELLYRCSGAFPCSRHPSMIR